MIPNCKKIYLCSPDNQIITVLNGVDTSTVDFHPQIKGYSELSFTVDRYVVVNGKQVESNGYEDLRVYMNVYLEDIGFFQIQNPEIYIDGDKETKSITAYSVEKEFEAKDWKGIKINTGQDDSIEYMYDDNIDSFGFAKRYVVMYDATDPRFSFLHLIIEKMSSNWKIGYVDFKIARTQIPDLEIDNENLYAVMTSEVGPRLSCLFIFDYLNYTINVYHKDSLDFDTGIFIGFRNLANEVTISVDQDSIFTRFTVAGEDDLNIDYYTYGTGMIMNLDYFLGEPYMSQELADKIRSWQDLREEYIDDYIATGRQLNIINEKLYELRYSVPADEYYWENWDGLSMDQLEKNKEMFEQQLQIFQILVDPRPNEDKYYNYGTEQETYAPKLNGEDVDHEWYLELLEAKMGEISGYHTYYEIVNYVLPYIELAESNIQNGVKVTPEEKGIGVLTENWDLYGYEELNGIRISYEQDLINKLSKYSKDWDDMTDEERQQKNLNYGDEESYEASAGRKEYLHLAACLGDEDDPAPGTIYYRLNQLEEQIDSVQEEYDHYLAIISEYNNIMNLGITNTEHYEDEYGDECGYENISQELIDARHELLFTEDELSLITTLIHDTDYTNSNIFSTSMDSVDTLLEKERELYDEAKEKLFEVSQPQYVFSVSMDNMLRLSEYEGWYDQTDMLYPNNNHPERYSNFGLLRFIHVGIRDDYSIKLRVIGYRWNPCEVTPDLTLEFSNMITSKSGRSDLVQLLDTENNTGSKNSISIGSGVERSDSGVLEKLVNMITTNSIFKNSVTNIAGGVVGQVDLSTMERMMDEYSGNLKVSISNITGTAQQFGAVFTNYLQGDLIATKIIDAEEGYFDELVSKIIRVGATEITNNVISTATIKASQIDATEGSFEQLATDILNAGTITVDMIHGEAGDFDTFFVNKLNVNNVFGNNADFATLVSDKITTGSIAAKLADIDEADIQVLFADNAFVRELQTVNLASIQTEASQAYIKNLVTQNISVAELQAGDITLSDNMKILSENGQLIMDGTAIQIYGKDEDDNLDELPGIQLGYDTRNKPSLIIRNADGAVILDAEGIKTDAIADGLIVNNMIEDNTIQKSKLGFNIVETDENGNIDISVIKDGTDSFGASYTSFKSKTETDLNNLETGVKYRVEVTSDNGTVFSPSNAGCVLTCKVYCWNEDITSTLLPSAFRWRRISGNSLEDNVWNADHVYNDKTLTLSAADLQTNCRFTCTVTID